MVCACTIPIHANTIQFPFSPESDDALWAEELEHKSMIIGLEMIIIIIIVAQDGWMDDGWVPPPPPPSSCVVIASSS